MTHVRHKYTRGLSEVNTDRSDPTATATGAQAVFNERATLDHLAKRSPIPNVNLYEKGVPG